MLCLEMVGYYSTDNNSQTVPPLIPKWMGRFFPHRGDFLAAIGNMPSWKLCWNFRRGFKRGARSMPLFSICLPEKINEIRLSDNSSFWDQGYPALMRTDTSFLRNPNYHRPRQLIVNGHRLPRHAASKLVYHVPKSVDFASFDHFHRLETIERIIRLLEPDFKLPAYDAS